MNRRRAAAPDPDRSWGRSSLPIRRPRRHTAHVKTRHHLSLSVLFAVTASIAVGCGSDDTPSSADTTVATPPETVTGGAAVGDTAATSPDSAGAPAQDSEFCRVAADAEVAGDEVDAAFAAGPAEVEAAVTAALEGAKATVELAPAEIVDLMNVTIEFQERFAALLEANGWDAVAAFATPEGQQLQADAAAVEPDLQRVRNYLEANCGIADDSQEEGSAATPELPEGEEGYRRFIQLYAAGASVEVTPEQEACFVRELSGTVEVAELQLALTEEAPEAVKQSVRSAFVACDIQVNSQ